MLRRRASIRSAGANLQQQFSNYESKYDKRSVKVVIDEGRTERHKKGTVINWERYYFDLTISKPDSEKDEFILIAVKNHQLKGSIEMIAPL